ncbi:MAG: transposase [Elusimicrobia bacterium]|nr:transposase [Elusimicrobiota bacterium]
MYIPKDSNTPKLFPDFFHLGVKLDSSNRWLKLASIIPWERLDELYGRYFSETGRPAKDSRLVCGLLILKQLKNLSDDEAVNEFKENPYIQAFCGCEYFVTENAPASGLLSERRKRLGEDFFDYLEGDVARILREQKFVRPKSRAQERPGILGSIITSIRGLFGK